MYIIHHPSLGQTEFYRLGDIVLSGGSMTVLLHREDEPPLAYVVGAGVQPNEQDVANWLVGVGGPLEGGTLVTNEAFALVAAKASLRENVRARRDRAVNGGCATPSGPADTDQDSRINICGAVSMAMHLGAAFSMEWRFADDTIVTLDSDEMIAVGLAVAAHLAACQANKNALDAAINTATTDAELEAIDLDAGWPTLAVS